MENFIREYVPYAKKLAYRYQREKNLPRTPISSAYFGLVLAAHAFRGDRKASFKTYARYRIRGQIADDVRQEVGRNGKQASHISLETIKDLCVDGTEAKIADRELVIKLLYSLPEYEATILMLYYLMGYKLREIGQMLGVSEGRISQVRKSALLEARIRSGIFKYT